MIPYYHNDGCGDIAFCLIGVPHYGERISSKIVRHKDGSEVSPCEPVVCDTCGGMMRNIGSGGLKRKGVAA